MWMLLLQDVNIWKLKHDLARSTVYSDSDQERFVKEVEWLYAGKYVSLEHGKNIRKLNNIPFNI